ncbi:putative protein S-acyltransferase 15 [Lathyrus oleraceus]|uniref:P-type ATPase A domain-containing protein n=1 Tax=Pisum sativum TaxID=3888 RepID=A0A9D4WE03_PEA|nr:putative protein S-acyltransferase 15 [Pisum sativum]
MISPSANLSEMVIPVFDGKIDAYWWVLCTEKYFKKWLTLETQKMAVAALAMKAMEEGICGFNQHSSSPVMADLSFAVPDDDEEESSFQSSLMGPDDVIIPTNQIEVSSFVLNDEHLVEENDYVGSSSPTATQTFVPILTPSNIDSELLVDNFVVVKPMFEVNVISDLSSYVREQLKDIVSRAFMNLDPVRWLADGSNSGYFHGDGDYEIPSKPPNAISKIERTSTFEAFTRHSLFKIQACPNVELMSTITFSHAKGSLQIFIDRQDTKTRHPAAHLSTKENNVGNVIVARMADLAPKTKVLSDGKWSEKEAPILVPSDVISIKLGDIIPVNARLLEGDSLRVNQAALTGKSLTVTQHPEQEVFSGSTCKQGEIEVVVIATGVNTFFRKATHSVDNTNNVGQFHMVLKSIENFRICSIAVGMLAKILIMRPIQHHKYCDEIDNILVILIGRILIVMATILFVSMTIGSHKFSQQGPYDYITSVIIEKGKQWDPGGYLRTTSIASMVTIQAVMYGTMVVGLTLTLLSLTGWHIYLILHNMTTIEYYEGNRAKWLAAKSGQSYRHPYNNGAYKNITLVLGPTMLKWLCPTAVSHLKDGVSFPTIRDNS